MPHTLRTSYFEYWDEAPHDWQKLIQERVDQGVAQITVPILWGVHESFPGIRDFSKQSKLRIERFLTLAQSLGVSVRLILGFPSHSQAFPTWVMNESHSEWVPKILWDGTPPYFSLLKVPSPRAQKVKEGFISFFEEVSSIISLYLSPGGPIREIELALQPLELSQSMYEDLNYFKYLEERYPDISVFNKRFQTHYKCLSSVTTSAGAKLIESKRPWLFAYDYQWARAKLVNEYRNEILNSRISDPLKKMIKPFKNSSLEKAPKSKKALVCFERTLIQFESSDLISPLMVQGQLSGSTVVAFQWAQMLAESLRNTSLDFISMPLLEADPVLSHSVMVIICGKYISSKAAKSLQQQLETGGFLFFPLGLPQYDENLDSHEWVLGGSRKTVRMGEIEWFNIQKAKGQIFYPSQISASFSPSNIKCWLRDFSVISEELSRG